MKSGKVFLIVIIAVLILTHLMTFIACVVYPCTHAEIIETTNINEYSNVIGNNAKNNNPYRNNKMKQLKVES